MKEIFRPADVEAGVPQPPHLPVGYPLFPFFVQPLLYILVAGFLDFFAQLFFFALFGYKPALAGIF